MREQPKIYSICRENASQNNERLNTWNMLLYRSRKCSPKITVCMDDRMTVQSAELRMCNSRNTLMYKQRFTLKRNYLYLLLQLWRSNSHYTGDKCLTNMPRRDHEELNQSYTFRFFFKQQVHKNGIVYLDICKSMCYLFLFLKVCFILY